MRLAVRSETSMRLATSVCRCLGTAGGRLDARAVAPTGDIVSTDDIELAGPVQEPRTLCARHAFETFSRAVAQSQLHLRDALHVSTDRILEKSGPPSMQGHSRYPRRPTPKTVSGSSLSSAFRLAACTSSLTSVGARNAAHSMRAVRFHRSSARVSLRGRGGSCYAERAGRSGPVPPA